MTSNERIAYLTGASNRYVEAVAHEYGIGLLTTPATNYRRQLALYPVWAADNGAYKRGADHRLFDFDKWAGWVESVAASTPAEVLARCLFFTAPDAIDVDLTGREVTSWPVETLARARTWLPWLRQLGLPTALVAQPGMVPSQVPWDLIDVVFLGGDTAWKIGAGAERVTAMAKSLGKRVHMGRVNSGKRLALAASWGVDTADGTYLRYGPTANLPNLLGWLDNIAAAA
jgi:hypothetical protein